MLHFGTPIYTYLAPHIIISVYHYSTTNIILSILALILSDLVGFSDIELCIVRIHNVLNITVITDE